MLHSNHPCRNGFTIGRLLVVIFIVATGLGLAIPKVLEMREAQLRTQSVQNLMRIALRFQGFYDVHKRIPYKGTPKHYEVDGVRQGGSVVVERNCR